jgi:hypothetical protein
MKTIDIHAHLVPRSLWKAAEAKVEWYGYRRDPGGASAPGGGGRRTAFTSNKVRHLRRAAARYGRGASTWCSSIHTLFATTSMRPRPCTRARRER